MVDKLITHVAILFVLKQLNNIFCMCFAENSILLRKCSFLRYFEFSRYIR